MAEGCGANCAKIMLIVFNIIFWLSGAALLGVGLWIRFDNSIFELLQVAQLDSNMKLIEYASYVIMGVGALVFLVGFLGCCGAIKENQACLGIYIAFLFLVMAIEIAAGVLAFLKKGDIEKFVDNELPKMLAKEYMSPAKNGTTNAITRGVDILQQEFMCCGINSAAEFQDNGTATARVFTTSGKTYPWSCCPKKDANSKSWEMTAEKVDCTKPRYTEGCKTKFNEFINKYSILLIGLAIGVAALEIFGIIFALCLCRNTSK